MRFVLESTKIYTINLRRSTQREREKSVYPSICSSIDLSMHPRLLISQWHWGHRLKPWQIPDKYSWNQWHIRCNAPSGPDSSRKLMGFCFIFSYFDLLCHFYDDCFCLFVCSHRRGPLRLIKTIFSHLSDNYTGAADISVTFHISSPTRWSCSPAHCTYPYRVCSKASMLTLAVWDFVSIMLEMWEKQFDWSNGFI